MVKRATGTSTVNVHGNHPILSIGSTDAGCPSVKRCVAEFEFRFCAAVLIGPRERSHPQLGKFCPVGERAGWNDFTEANAIV